LCNGESEALQVNAWAQTLKSPRGDPQSAAQTKERRMKHKNIENRLALLGAIVVLIGVSSAATSALAAETLSSERTVSASEIARVTLEGGRRANRRSADAAVEAITLDNWTGLDIELANRTSRLVGDAS
jgi:NH3-dependent NAD+ synthetase